MKKNPPSRRPGPPLCVDCGLPVLDPTSWGGACLHGPCRSARGGKGSIAKAKKHCGLPFNPKAKGAKPI